MVVLSGPCGGKFIQDSGGMLTSSIRRVRGVAQKSDVCESIAY